MNLCMSNCSEASKILNQLRVANGYEPLSNSHYAGTACIALTGYPTEHDAQAANAAIRVAQYSTDVFWIEAKKFSADGHDELFGILMLAGRQALAERDRATKNDQQEDIVGLRGFVWVDLRVFG